MQFTTTVDIPMTPATLAAAFCEMDDEQQAQFFIEAARIAQTWPSEAKAMQWFYVGRHLKTCACSTWEARDMVREIAGALEDSP
jgi:hypothetical protein